MGHPSENYPTQAKRRLEWATRQGDVDCEDYVPHLILLSFARWIFHPIVVA